jgi:hypothetical protein
VQTTVLLQDHLNRRRLQVAQQDGSASNGTRNNSNTTDKQPLKIINKKLITFS